MNRVNREEQGIREVFRISIILKGLNALLEVGLGVILFFTARHADVLVALVSNELVDDPDGFLARHQATVMGYLDPHVQLFAALYLVVHGLVKACLVWGLLREKLWAYPASIAVFLLFILYQSFRYLHHHSLPLLALTVFDVFVVTLISHEYRRRLIALHISSAA